MSDLIRVVELEVWARLGVTGEERAEPQRLLVSLEMSVDCFPQAAAGDDVALTVNYFEVVQRVKFLVAQRPRKLLETLAEDISTDVLKTFSMQKLVLEIKKFILTDTRYVSVVITRSALG